MFQNKKIGFSSDIFDKRVYNLFSNRSFAFGKIDQAVFVKVKKIFPFIKTLVVPRQVHSSNVAVIKKQHIQNKSLVRIALIDAVITCLPRVALGVLSADCLPVLLSDGNFIASYHAGWKGSLENIAGKVVGILKKEGVEIQNLKVALGPSIGGCCYFIDEKRIQLFSQAYPEWRDEILLERNNKVYLNLLKLNYLQLVKKGVKKENIDFLPFCTSCDKRFFSFRRDGKVEREMISLIAKEK